jgi:DNA-binding NarL/FixJ family response regulator
VFISQPGWSGWRSLRARALDGLGRREEALQAAQEEVAAARRWGASGLIGRSLALLGRIERERGLDHLREAVDLLEHSTAKYELAAAKLALGAALRHARRPADAREPLREALELAEQCGAQRLVDQARSELYAAGARPRSSALGGFEALTASERRVAGLAAEGRTNKEIAQVLYVTPKTVEVHLSSAYRKLDIRSRQELARAMAP